MFNPLLYLLGDRVIFYGHFPETLYAPDYLMEESSPLGRFWRRIYRSIIARLEAYGIATCDKVIVNSAFTRGKFLTEYPNHIDK